MGRLLARLFQKHKHFRDLSAVVFIMTTNVHRVPAATRHNDFRVINLLFLYNSLMGQCGEYPSPGISGPHTQGRELSLESFLRPLYVCFYIIKWED